MRKFLALLLLAGAAVLSASCSKTTTPIEPSRWPAAPAVADQTVMIYLTGTSLGSENRNNYFLKNITDAMSVIEANPSLLERNRVLVFYEYKRNAGAVMELYYNPAERKCMADTLQRYSQTGFSSMDGETMRGILQSMASQAPADSYGLVMGGHGFAWVPQGVNISRTEGPVALMGGTLPLEQWMGPRRTDKETRWFGDQGRRAEIQNLAQTISSSGIRFNYLLFDACFMSSIEALYDLRTAAARIIASPTEVMADGYPYAKILPRLLAQDLEGTCQAFHDYYLHDNPTPSATVALTVTAELEGLAATVRAIESSAAASGATYDRSTLQTYEGAVNHIFYDLNDYVRAICSDPTLLAAFDAQMKRTFPTRLHTPGFYSAYGYTSDLLPIDDNAFSGVSTSVPCSQVHDLWKQTAWYISTH